MKKIFITAMLFLSVVTVKAQNLTNLGNSLVKAAKHFTFQTELVDTVFTQYWSDGSKTFETISNAPTSPIAIIAYTYKAMTTKDRPGHIATSSVAFNVGAVVTVLNALSKGDPDVIRWFANNALSYTMCKYETVDTFAAFEQMTKDLGLSDQLSNVLFGVLELDKE